VRDAEAVLAEYLASREASTILRGTRIRSQLHSYKRQYWGETRGERRRIRIWFYHEDTPVVKKGRWLKYSVSVAGGGDHYFHVTYDVGRRRFANLRVNAPE